MFQFTISFTSPDPKRPQPASPVDLDPSFVFHQISDGASSNAPPGRIKLKDVKGELREYEISQVRPFLDADGNQDGYEMFVV